MRTHLVPAFLFLAGPVLAQTHSAWQYVGAPGVSEAGAICSRVATDPGGNVYVAYQDQQTGLGARVTAKRRVGDAWLSAGSAGAGSIGAGYYCNLAFDAQNRLLVATRDYALAGGAGVRRFDPIASTWSSVGSGAGPYDAHYVDIAMAPDGRPCVVYANTTLGDRATAMRFDGVSWTPLGTPGFTPAAALYPRIAIAQDGTIYIAYADASLPDATNVGKATVRRFDPASSTWNQVGSPGFSAFGAANLALTLDRTGVPWIAYYRHHSAIVVMRFDGTSWVTTPGSPCGADAPTIDTEPWRQWLSLQFDSQNRPYVAYQLFHAARKAVVRRLEGNDWALVGQWGFTPGAADYLSMVVDAQDVPWVAFRDGANGQRVSVMRCVPVAQNFCTSMPNSLGCSATMLSTGAPSAGGNTQFLVRAGNVLGGTTGVLVWGTQGAALPFGGGTLCVSTFQRTPAVTASGVPGTCTGLLQADFGALLAAGLPGVALGTIVSAQFWYRDVNGPGGFALSDGLRFTVGY